MTTRLATLDEYGNSMRERDLMQGIIQLAGWLGWRCYHPWTSVHSAAGWPDVTLVRHGRIIMAELKSARGTVAPAQQAWLDDLAAAGIETYVWRPAHWRDGTIERILKGG